MHTDSVSWSITTAEQARRYTLFELTLLEGEPTTYVVDGAPEPMQRREVSVEVKQPDGSLQTVTRAQWWTRFGPVVGAGTQLQMPAWHAGDGEQPGHAYVMADANASNLRLLNTLFAFNQAQSTADVLAAIRETQGVPWWTVVAADAAGETLWSQVHVLPNVSNEHAERCNTEAGRGLFAATGYAILDGSRSECAWQTDADAVQPGIFGPGPLDQPTLPFVRSARYLENSNDSHWLPSAELHIDGMPRILGAEGSERSLRTRGVITQLEDQLASGPLDRQAVQDLVLSNHSYSADLVVAETVDFCRQIEGGMARDSQGQLVNVGAACEVLAGWDHHMDADSPGALLFTRYWTKALALADTLGVSPWQVPFDVKDPVNTPHTLDVTAPFVATALADAVSELRAAGIPLAALLGDYQYAERDGQRWPIGGGTDALAVINMIAAEFGPDGFREPFYGSGYLHVVAFDGDDCPDAVTLLTYSQSTEPTSPHFSDQTELYSRKQWVTERFCEKDILASPVLEVVRFE